MYFTRKKRLILLFLISLIAYSLNAGADSSAASWTRAYCLYNAGSGGYACDSGQVGGDSTSCSAQNGVQCAVEGDVYCYSQSSCEVGSTTDGPDNAYNVNYDADSADCSCIGDTWTTNFEAGLSPNCCEDDSGENYVTQGVGSDACCNAATDCVDSGNSCRDEYPTEVSCSDGIDNDCDGSTDCQDTDCDGRIEGNVEDQDNDPLESATVQAFRSSTLISQGSTNSNGDYGFVIACGTYNLAASKTDYISDAATGITVPPKTTIQQDFTLTYGIVCEADCSYLIDTRCHQECHGVKGCSFYDGTVMSNCDKSRIGWEVDYDSSNIVECCTGSPTEKSEQKANAVCSSGNLVKSYRLLYLGGKPIRMVLVVCGD